MTRVLIRLIRLYQRWLSPLLPPSCRFWPTCSEYAATALAVHGFWRGCGLALWRLLRCNPFVPGGEDPVPPRSKPAALAGEASGACGVAHHGR
jgi:putative membrane protein insertion efficiency factor